MKRLKRVLACSCALALCVSLVACGKKDSSEKKEETTTTTEATEELTEEVTEASGEAETKTWGDFTITVPAGFEFKGGDVFDENDTNYFSVKKGSFSYFDFKNESEETMNKQYNYNKNTYTNEQTDVKGTFGGIDWTGFQYSDGFGGYGFELYATSKGKFLRVSSAGFKFDDPIVKEVLDSLVIGEGGADKASASDAEATTEEEEVINYTKVVEMDKARFGVPEGYSIIKEASTQLVLSNDETGGRVSVLTGSKTAEEQLDAVMGDAEAEKEEWDIDDIHWVGYSLDEGYYTVLTNVAGGYVMIDLQFGTMEELEMLIKGLEYAE